jgi:trans-aconitate methyltransferase
MTDTIRSHWQAVWATKAPEAVSWYQPDPATSLALVEAAGTRPDEAVVDVGGGASLLVDRLLDRGFTDLTVLDVAAAALAHGRARLGERVAWVEADVLAWRPGRRFGLWHDRAVFHFLLEDEDQQAYRRVLEAAVAPGGQVILATFAPDGPERCSGLPVRRNDADGLARALGPAFTLLEQRREEHRTPGGALQRFCWCRFRCG